MVRDRTLSLPLMHGDPLPLTLALSLALTLALAFALALVRARLSGALWVTVESS